VNSAGMLSFSCRSMEKGHLRAANSLWLGIAIPGPNVACLQSLRTHDVVMSVVGLLSLS
jgi:hypothetical protein